MKLRAIVVCAVAVAASTVAGPSASASTAKVFANCTQMHQTYVGGVAKPGARDRRVHGGHARYAPKVSAALYAANRKSDRDNDGVACEQ